MTEKITRKLVAHPLGDHEVKRLHGTTICPFTRRPCSCDSISEGCRKDT